MDTLTSRFTNCSDNEGIGFYYTYNGKGKLVRIEMKSVTIADGTVTGGTLLSSENYLYDGSDRLIRVVETDGDNVVLHDFSWTYDAKDNVTALTESIGGKSFSYTYAYDDDSRPTTFAYGSVTKDISYDGHGRSSGTSVRTGGSTVLGTEYAYRDVDSTYTTTQVESVTNSYGGKTSSFSYAYDANGNIVSVSGDETVTYEYDALGQLITETVGSGDEQVIVRYTYDNGGNLIKKVREYTTEAPEPEPTPEPEPEPTPVPEPEPEPDPTPTPTPTPEPTPKPSREPIPINPPVTPTPSVMSLEDGEAAVNSSDRVTVQEETLYTYGDAEWGDLLTAYNGEEITYDGIGNPLSYRGWTMNWQGGRQLAAMTDGSSELSFAYNESGLRTSKTVNGVAHSYVWQGSKLAADITDAYTLYFHYDSTGDVIGFTMAENGADTEYFYVKNLQGDVLSVISADGTEAATYTYDAWGRVLTSTGNLADINPLRYRGYYYDVETGLYYLQSRYYDPEICRFINPDAFASTGQGILGANMFAYCYNNSIMLSDKSGTLSAWALNLTDCGGGYSLTELHFKYTIYTISGWAKDIGAAAWSSVDIDAGIGIGIYADAEIFEDFRVSLGWYHDYIHLSLHDGTVRVSQSESNGIQVAIPFWELGPTGQKLIDYNNNIIYDDTALASSFKLGVGAALYLGYLGFNAGVSFSVPNFVDNLAALREQRNKRN